MSEFCRTKNGVFVPCIAESFPIIHERTVWTVDGDLVMTWLTCDVCDRCRPFAGPEAPMTSQIRIELRAAVIAQWLEERTDSARVGDLAKICNGAEIRGWIIEAVGAFKVPIDDDEHAGALAATIYMHDVTIALDAIAKLPPDVEISKRMYA